MKTLKGVYEIRRYDRKTGEYLGTIRGENAIQTAGKQLFLDVGIGASANDMAQGNAVIEVLDSGPSQVFTQVGSDAGTPNASTTKQIFWEWTDDSTNTYTVDTINFRQGSLTGTIFSQVTGGPFADNSKDSTETWIYKYTLSISEGVDEDLQDDGLHAWLEIFGGIEDDDWSAIEIEVENSTPTILGSQVVDGSFPTRSAETVTWQFTVPDGQIEGDWHNIRVQGTVWTDTTPVLSDDPDGDHGEGVKGAGEEWVYTYTFSI